MRGMCRKSHKIAKGGFRWEPSLFSCREDAGKGKVVRLGGHVLDALLLERHAGYEAIVAQLRKEPVVVSAAIPKAHKAAIEGNQGDDGDIEQLLVGFLPALAVQVIEQIGARGMIEEGGALHSQVAWRDWEEPCAQAYPERPSSYKADRLPSHVRMLHIAGDARRLRCSSAHRQRYATF